MRFMVVGTGFAKTHIEWISEIPSASVEILCYQRNETRARELAQQYGVAQLSTYPLRAIKDGGIDAIAVVSPPDTHEALISAGLRAGLAIVTDKPLAESTQATERLAAEARLVTGKAAVSFQWRTHPAFRKLRTLINNGDLGNLLHVNLQFHHDFLAGPSTQWPWRHRSAEAGAGALGDQGVHLFDLLRYISPSEWSITASSSLIAWRERSTNDYAINCDTDDIAEVLLLDTAHEARAHIMVSRVATGHRELSAVVQGSQGTVLISLHPDTGAGTLRQSIVRRDNIASQYATQPLNPYWLFVASLIDGDGRRIPEIADFDDGHAAQVLLEEAVRRANVPFAVSA